ncbi:PKD domain-containing protein [Massilia sp. CF038]|uniref:PKD domain-containing protein n=1 Tax=Massilia sp. CF038 TaxID=1881045 RepID=UPI00091EB896|nr:PKD domain-containing protein [Massilia sp. CF038]SHH08962.1 probable extracellular repeat, HAF family [Massilia sp. CF038]
MANRSQWTLASRAGTRACLGMLAALALGNSAWAAPDPAAASGTTYRVINLGPGDPVGAYINASGQVAFSITADRDSPPRTIFYDGTGFQDIGTLGGDFARPTALSNSGVVAGQSYNGAHLVRSFVWSRARGMLDLGAIPGNNETWEPAMNNKGVVAGYSTGPAFQYAHAYRWSYSTGIEDLGAFTSGPDSVSQATAINDAGVIAGTSMTPAFDYHAFAWTRATGLVDIDTLGTRYSAPVAVGASGQVAGNYFPASANGRVFIWTRAEGMRDIGSLGFDGAWMNSMSANGQITGVLASDTAYNKGMTWTRESGLINLGTFGGDVSSAVAANTKGQVVGGAATRDDFHAYVWTARTGKIDLNKRLRKPPAGLVLSAGIAISDNGSIVATSNAGLVLLVPVCGCPGTPALGPVNGPDMVQAGTIFDATLAFSADNTASHHLTWSWGDGSGSQAGAVRADPGGGNGTGQHVYTRPGIYTVTAQVSDVAGRTVAVSRKVVVHDGAGTTVGAGGFIAGQVPHKGGQLVPGKANFQFLAPRAQSALPGQLDFQAGTLNFRSRVLRPAGAAGQYAGNGQLNGKAGYQFLMQTVNGRFGLKIWHHDPASKAQVIDYDNLGNGSTLVEGKISAL